MSLRQWWRRHVIDYDPVDDVRQRFAEHHCERCHQLLADHDVDHDPAPNRRHARVGALTITDLYCPP